MGCQAYTIDDLPRFSKWPARLLGLESFGQRYKTPAEIDREYEREKWGPLLNRVLSEKQAVPVEVVDRWSFEGSSTCLCSVGDRLEQMSALGAHRRHKDLVYETLARLLPSSAVVELGAGYGAVILDLAKREPISSLPILAGEYTSSGVRLIGKLAQTQGLEITVGHCDFNAVPVAGFQIPAHSLIFTSFATHYVERLTPEFVESICDLQPRAVVHFEPCHEHCDTSTTIGLMRQRYIELNGYNRNLASLLHEAHRKGMITIVEESPAVFGANPFLPASIIVWSPRRGQE
jgi:hypothetical protein